MILYFAWVDQREKVHVHAVNHRIISIATGMCQ